MSLARLLGVRTNQVTVSQVKLPERTQRVQQPSVIVLGGVKVVVGGREGEREGERERETGRGVIDGGREGRGGRERGSEGGGERDGGRGREGWREGDGGTKKERVEREWILGEKGRDEGGKEGERKYREERKRDEVEYVRSSCYSPIG